MDIIYIICLKNIYAIIIFSQFFSNYQLYMYICIYTRVHKCIYINTSSKNII